MASAVLTGTYPGTDEKVINMESFHDELVAVDCTPPTMSMQFAHQEAYDAAKQQWGWVNGKDQRFFILFANDAKCGPSKQRVPYNVTKITYDDKKKLATMRASKLDFKSAVRQGSLRVESQAQPIANNASVTPRFRIGQSGSIHKDFSGNIFNVGSGGNNVRLDCTDCGTDGMLGVAFDASWGVKGWWPPKLGVTHAFLEFWGTNVMAKLNVALSGQSGPQSGRQKLFSFQIFGLEIPGVMRLGVGPEFGVGYSVAIAGGGKVSWGANAYLTPNSYSKICFVGCSNQKQG
jgi:hypothetical protein